MPQGAEKRVKEQQGEGMRGERGGRVGGRAEAMVEEGVLQGHTYREGCLARGCCLVLQPINSRRREVLEP